MQHRFKAWFTLVSQAQAQAQTPGIRTRRISHLRTKPFMRVPMPRICVCACAYLTSVNQALVLCVFKFKTFLFVTEWFDLAPRVFIYFWQLTGEGSYSTGSKGRALIQRGGPLFNGEGTSLEQGTYFIFEKPPSVQLHKILINIKITNNNKL